MKNLAAVLAFVAASTVAALGLGAVLHGLNVTFCLCAMGLGLLFGVLAWRGTANAEKTRTSVWDWFVLTVFALVSLRAFLWLIFPRGNELLVLSPNNLGDLGMHINFIRYFASGIPFWPESPLLSSVALSYPLGTDLFNSILEVLGTDTFRGLIWTGLLGAALTGYALWRWGGAFGVAAFLFNGGLTGFAIFQTLQVEDFQKELVWKNLFLAMFITQRGLLFALPAGLLLLTTWRNKYFRDGKKILPFWLQIFLYSVMPLFSIHTFIFLSLMLLAIFFANKAARSSLMLLVGAAFVPATWFVWLLTAEFSASSGFRFLPGWIADGKGWTVWVWNFGLTLPLVLILAIILFRERDREARCYVWTALLIFVLCCVFALAPWPWDNMKLMMWSWLVIAPYLWSKVLARLETLPCVAMCFLLFFSGAVSLLGGLDARHGYTIARLSELADWKHATRHIPFTARFAMVPDFNHPLLLLGRKAACAYEGHLWSHGLDYRQKLDTLNAALHGRISWKEAAPALEVSWVALRPSDLANVSSPDLVFPDFPRNCLYDLAPFNQAGRNSQSDPRLRPQSTD